MMMSTFILGPFPHNRLAANAQSLVATCSPVTLPTAPAFPRWADQWTRWRESSETRLHHTEQPIVPADPDSQRRQDGDRAAPSRQVVPLKNPQPLFHDPPRGDPHPRWAAKNYSLVMTHRVISRRPLIADSGGGAAHRVTPPSARLPSSVAASGPPPSGSGISALPAHTAAGAAVTAGAGQRGPDR